MDLSPKTFFENTPKYSKARQRSNSKKSVASNTATKIFKTCCKTIAKPSDNSMSVYVVTKMMQCSAVLTPRNGSLTVHKIFI